MADYEKMYAVLCGAVDEVIEPLERIPLALPYARALRAALLQADTNDGILLHGDEERLWCAYLPLRTRAQVMEAHEIAARLSRLAQSADGVLLPMEEQILRAGTYSLKEILTALAERVDS